MKKSKKSLPKIRPILSDMTVGQTVTFPIERMKSVRAQASELGAILNVKYVTRTDRDERTIEVTRVS